MLINWEVTLPALTGRWPRQAYIWLPDSYEEDETKHYPVLYMFDGQNVFLDEDASYGKSWGMAEYLSWTEKEVIVVGVECNTRGNGRLREYTPVDFKDAKYGNVRSQGQRYMHWLVKKLKPSIDANFRTLPDRENTFIAGSSMGGLMAVYAAAAYHHVFSRAACLSPSLWVEPEKVRRLVARSHVGRDTVMYMDYGSMLLFSSAMILVLHLRLSPP